MMTTGYYHLLTAFLFLGEMRLFTMVSSQCNFNSSTNLRSEVTKYCGDQSVYCDSNYGINLECGAIEFWDVSEVTDMENTFYMRDFAGEYAPKNLSSWDVSSVTNMKDMFRESRFYGYYDAQYDMYDPRQDLAEWSVSKVTSMSGMFNENPLMNSNITMWDVSRVTAMGAMFYDARMFNQNISRWNVSSVTDMWSMFKLADNFNVDISGWNVARVTDVYEMFGDSWSDDHITSLDDCTAKKIYDSWSAQGVDMSESDAIGLVTADLASSLEGDDEVKADSAVAGVVATYLPILFAVASLFGPPLFFTAPAVYDPLASLLIDKKKVKGSKDVGSLIFPPPMGIRPKEFPEEIAREFVKVFVPEVKAALKKDGKKTTMFYVRKMVKSFVSTSDNNVRKGGGGTPHKKDSRRTASVVVPKREYGPLLTALAHSGMKRKSDIKSLSMAPPLGSRPPNCNQKIAVDFVESFIPLMWKQLETEGKKLTMANLLELSTRIGRESGDGGTNSNGGGSDGGFDASRGKSEDVLTSSPSPSLSTPLSMSAMRRRRLSLANMPKMEIAFIPLVASIIRDHVKKLEDVEKLTKELRPHQVSKDTAKRFVKKFLPALKFVIERNGEVFTIETLKSRLLSLTSETGGVLENEEDLQNRTLHYQHSIEDSLVYGLRASFRQISSSAAVIDALSIRQVLANYDEDFDEHDVNAVIRDLSGNKSDRYVEFMDYAVQMDNSMRRDDRPFVELFDTINSDTTGHLKEADLMRWALTVGEKLSHGELREMLSFVSTKDDLLHFLSRRGKRRFVETYRAHDEDLHKKAAVPPVSARCDDDAKEHDASAKTVRNNPRYRKYFELMDLHMEMSDLKSKMRAEDPDLDPSLLLTPKVPDPA
eukprot:g4476.t1